MPFAVNPELLIGHALRSSPIRPAAHERGHSSAMLGTVGFVVLRILLKRRVGGLLAAIVCFTPVVVQRHVHSGHAAAGSAARRRLIITAVRARVVDGWDCWRRPRRWRRTSCCCARRSRRTCMLAARRGPCVMLGAGDLRGLLAAAALALGREFDRAPGHCQPMPTCPTCTTSMPDGADVCPRCSAPTPWAIGRDTSVRAAAAPHAERLAIADRAARSCHRRAQQLADEHRRDRSRPLRARRHPRRPLPHRRTPRARAAWARSIAPTT